MPLDWFSLSEALAEFPQRIGSSRYQTGKHHLCRRKAGDRRHRSCHQQASSYVGTEGYVPPEGPGSAPADLYSLGKVLYEIAMERTGSISCDQFTTRRNCPTRNAAPTQRSGARACANDPAERYASAEQMHADLVRLNATTTRFATPPALAMDSRRACGARPRRRALSFLRTQRPRRSIHRDRSA